MREVEFLPTWYPKVRQRRRMVALQAWITLILVAGLGLWMLLVQRNVHARQIELSSLRADLSQSETDLQRLDDLLELQKPLRRQEEIFNRIGRPVESTRIMTTLEKMMPPDMAIMDLVIESEEAPKVATGLAARATKEAREKQSESKLHFRMHGIAPTDVDLAEFLGKLSGQPFFNTVELIYSHEREDHNHVMREFEVTFIMDLAGLGGGK
jgi:hypothetical protein